ncbi:PA domain-containing protein [Brevibacillus borstelensis]|uniref:PA domain-containing protein n=1 Tax=Brevibacillus borstelensis TaxID=45462 RepID=UPI0030C1687A
MRAGVKWLITVFVACGSLIPLSGVTAAVVGGQADPDRLLSHVEKLSSSPRITATESEFQAVVYIEEWLRIYGYQPKLLPFSFYVYSEPKQISLQITEISGKKWAPRSVLFGSAGEAAGAVLDVGTGTPEEFAKEDADGKIVVIHPGGIPEGEKVRYAAAAGAKGAILIQGANAPKVSLGGPLDIYVPVLAISESEGEQLGQQLQKGGKLTARLKVSGASILKKTSYNLTAELKPNNGNTGQIVLVAAHHDASLGKQEENDASGTAVLLETARLLTGQARDTEVRFVSLGAASDGERGLDDYLRSLPETERAKIAALIYLGNVRQGEGELTLYTSNGKRNLAADLLEAKGASFSPAAPEKVRNRLARIAQAKIPSTVQLVRAAAAKNGKDENQKKKDPQKLEEAAQTVADAISTVTDASSGPYPI